MTAKAQIAAATEHAPDKTLINGHPASTPVYDGLMIVLALWLLVGMFADAWAHANGLVETFFTPWHGIIYSGLVANALGVFSAIWRNQRRGFHGWNAIPAGYEPSAVGVIVFAVAGVADLIWHNALGVEVQLEAAFSPPHMGLMAGFVLLMSGPFRSVWLRRQQPFSNWQSDWRDYLPMTLSLTFLMFFFWIVFVPFHPFYESWLSAPEVGEVGRDNSVLLGMSTIIINAAITMSLLLIALRRFHLLPGTVTFIFTFNVLGICAFTGNWQFFPGAIISGLFADAFIWKLNPSLKDLAAYHLFAGLVPFVFYGLYVIEVARSTGIAWSMPFVGGVFVIPSLVGLLISYLIVPAQGAVTLIS